MKLSGFDHALIIKLIADQTDFTNIVLWDVSLKWCLMPSDDLSISLLFLDKVLDKHPELRKTLEEMYEKEVYINLKELEKVYER